MNDTQDNIHARYPRWRRLSNGICRLEHHGEPLFPISGDHVYKLEFAMSVLIAFSFLIPVLRQRIPVRQVWYVLSLCRRVVAISSDVTHVVNSIGPQVSFPVRTCLAFSLHAYPKSRLRHASPRYPELQRSQHARCLALGSRCRGRETQFACTRDDRYGRE